MPELNLDQIHAMEEEFLKLQKIELNIDSDRSKTDVLINSYATSVSSYTKRKELEKLIKEAEEIIADIAKTGNIRGRAMSRKTMDRFLEESERSIKKGRVLDLISRKNSKRARERMELYSFELLREAGIMKSDIELFIKRSRVAGLPIDEINKRMVRAAFNKSSPINAFGKRLKTLEKSVLRREALAAEIEEYSKVSKKTESWQWITISTGPCPDCRIRAGVILPFYRWEKKGLPGSGATICRDSCMCKLYPVTVAEDLFPEVKTFQWNKESGVLTTFGDMRTFGAKGNQK